MSYLSDIVTSVPEYRHSQSDIAGYFLSFSDFSGDVSSRKIKAVAQRSGISSRHSVLSDFSGKEHDQAFFHTNPGQYLDKSIEKRLSLFREKAPPLSAGTVRKLDSFEK